jgi:acetyl-CoA carboxylase carboxyltransferase component
MYENGKALNVAMYHEIDAVIDPRDTRKWIMNGIRTMPPGKKGGKGKRPFIDTW